MSNKMLKYLLLLCSLLSCSLGLDGKLVISIPKQTDTILRIPSLDLKVGESGIITRSSNNNEFIIANVVVDSIEDGVAKLTYSKFNTISQQYMPHPLGTPMEGDKVIFRILYNRALIVAPNQNLYQKVVDNNDAIDFIHSDIFASFLTNNKSNMPTKNDFTKFCNKFSIGIVFIWRNNSLFTLDCNSLKVLDRKTLIDVTVSSLDVKLPFFTRLSNEALDEMFDMEKMQDYDVYYGKFVGIE